MKPIVNVPAVLSMLLFLASCMAASSGWRYEEKAINLSFEAEGMLNVRGGVPHPLAICVYQLGEPGAFKDLAQSADGLYRLLECTAFDASVVDAKRVIVNPGKGRKVSLDRAEGARFVGIVAGYYTIDKGRMVRFFSIPWQTAGVSSGVQAPLPLNVTIRLGAKGILPFRATDAAPGHGGENFLHIK